MSNFKSPLDYHDFIERIKSGSRYARSKEDIEFLDSVLASAKRTGRFVELSRGKHYYRAQKGFRECEDPKAITPFEADRMKPKKEHASAGRINPAGVPVLYLATDFETAISEARPWKGAYVTVAEFETTRDLVIADCALYHNEEDTIPMVHNLLKDYYLSNPDYLKPDAIEKEIWIYIDKSFSEPLKRGDDLVDYIHTQIIAEYLRNHGADGIAYKSSYDVPDGGYNIALFNTADANSINETLVQVNRARFCHQILKDRLSQNKVDEFLREKDNP